MVILHKDRLERYFRSGQHPVVGDAALEQAVPVRFLAIYKVELGMGGMTVHGKAAFGDGGAEMILFLSLRGRGQLSREIDLEGVQSLDKIISADQRRNKPDSKQPAEPFAKQSGKSANPPVIGNE